MAASASGRSLASECCKKLSGGDEIRCPEAFRELGMHRNQHLDCLLRARRRQPQACEIGGRALGFACRAGGFELLAPGVLFGRALGALRGGDALLGLGDRLLAGGVLATRRRRAPRRLLRRSLVRCR